MRSRLLLASVLIVVAALFGAFLLYKRAHQAPAEEISTEPASPPGPFVGDNFVDRFQRFDPRRWQRTEAAAYAEWMENDWRADRANISTEGLTVTMSTSAAGSASPLTAGEISTLGSFRYGYYEVRMRVAKGPGVITAAFSYAPRQGRVASQEIDIEMLGRDTRAAYLGYHVAGHSAEKIVRLPFDASEGFHNYGYEWSPRSIRWYIDGDMVYELTDSRLQHMSNPQRLFLDIWATDTLYRWAGRIDPSAQPWRSTFACVARAPTYPGRPLCDASR